MKEWVKAERVRAPVRRSTWIIIWSRKLRGKARIKLVHGVDEKQAKIDFEDFLNSPRGKRAEWSVLSRITHI